MIKKIAIGLLILALLVVAAVGVVTWHFSSLVTPQIERYLSRHGVETLRTSTAKWRFNHLRMDLVEASGNLDGSHIVVHLENVEIGYQWWRLFDGSIDNIAIEQADVVLVLSATGDETPPDLLIPALLPQAWLGQLPVDTLKIAKLDGRVQSGDNWALALAGNDLQINASQLTLQGTLLIREGNSVGLLTEQWGASDPGAVVVLEVNSSTAAPLNITASVSNRQQLVGNAALVWAQAMDGEKRKIERQIVEIKGRVGIEALTAQLNALRSDPHPLAAGLPLDWLDGLPPVSGSSDFAIKVEMPEHIQDSYGAWLNQITVDGTFSHQIGIASWPQQGLSDVKATFGHTLAGGLDNQNITFLTVIEVSGLIAADKWGVPREFGHGKEGFDQWQGVVPLALQLEPRGMLILNEDGWRLHGLSAVLALGPDNQRIALDAVVENLEAGQERFSFNTDIAASVSLGGQVLAAPHIAAQVEHNSGGWRGKGDMSEANLTLTGQWHAELVDTGGFGFNLKGKVASLPTLLEQAEEYVSLPVALAEGAGSFTYDLKGASAEPGSTPVTTQKLQFNLSGLTGLLEGFALQNAALQGAVDKTHSWQSRGNIQISVPALAVGVSIEAVDIVVQLLPSQSLAQTRWRVHDLGAKIFSGSVSLRQPFTLNFPLTETHFEMQLSNWQLGAILGLYERHGLSGNGILSGVLPVRISSEGVAIEGGELVSQPPGGLIVYDTGDSGKSVAANNEYLDLAVSLLENFEYERLAVKADFAPTGVLLLGLQLSGRNPDAFSGRPVNFNINVEENLFDLFKALTLTDDVINTLERRLNR